MQTLSSSSSSEISSFSESSAKQEKSSSSKSSLGTDSDFSDQEFEEQLRQKKYHPDHFSRRNALKDKQYYFNVQELEMWQENKHVRLIHSLFQQPVNRQTMREEEIERGINRERAKKLVEEEIQRQKELSEDEEIQKMREIQRSRTRELTSEICSAKLLKEKFKFKVSDLQNQQEGNELTANQIKENQEKQANEGQSFKSRACSLSPTRVTQIFQEKEILAQNKLKEGKKTKELKDKMKEFSSLLSK